MKAKGLAKFTVIALAAFVLMIIGCSSSVRYSPEDEQMYVKSVIAVERFENRVPVSVPWQIGDAIAEQLTERLVQTRRYDVLAYGPLRPVPVPLAGSANQSSAEADAEAKRAEYIIRGVITDFQIVDAPDGIFSSFTANKYAVVRAIIHVVDTGDGSVKASETIEKRVAYDNVDAAYDQMAFGSYIFNQTSLGQATSQMLDQAVVAVAESIAQRQWQPKIASVMDNSVVINGGSNRGVQRGDVYVVRSVSQAVYDPDESNPIGHVAGGFIGRVRVVQVTERFAIAEVVAGSGFTRGQTLFPSSFNTSRQSVRGSSY